MIPQLDPSTLQHEVPFYTEVATLLTLPPGTNGKLLIPRRLAANNRTIQNVDVEDAGALESYLTKNVSTPETLAIYIDTRARAITAVLDHAAEHSKPGFNEHTATLKLEFSAEFAPLFAILNKPMTQDCFLDFIDRQSHLFMEASTLKEVCANFHSVTITRVKSIKDNANGTGKFTIDTDELQDQELRTPPRVITTTVAIFPDESPVELEVMVRYRAPGGKLEFTLLVPGLESIVRKEVAKIETRLRVFIGQRSEKSAAWTSVLIVRASTPRLGKPMDAKEVDLTGGVLPQDLTLKTGFEFPTE